MSNPSQEHLEDKPSPKQVVGMRPMTAHELRQHEDGVWGNNSPEVQQHAGKAVVIKDKRVIAVNENAQTALQEATTREQCPWWDFVVLIVPPPELWEVPPATSSPTEP